MLFNSTEFLIFFPIVVLLYYFIPVKIKYLWLLSASYYFYMCWNAKYAFLILFSTMVTYTSGIAIEKIKRSEGTDEKSKRRKQFYVAVSFVLNLSVLFFFKYFNFVFGNLEHLFNLFHIQFQKPVFDILLPVGISFYTFQALGYTMDVYRGDIYAEKNFFRYALFVSFFPQLVAGPIERSKNLLKQLAVPSNPNFESMRDGIYLMLWGYFLKVVLADRIAIFVDTVYGDFTKYGGYYLVVATALFAVQIYCDFSGYSTIAMGAAEVLGIRLMENFDAPYLSRSVSEFWRRWHISLSSWFRDYLYIPLGGNRKGRFRKQVNLMIVFLLSGFWHGSKWSFIVWGGLNGLYQVIGSLGRPFRDKIVRVLHLNRNSFGHKLMQTIMTFVLIDFTWIFFRANRFLDAVAIIREIAGARNLWILFDSSLYQCGLSQRDFILILMSIGILFLVDHLKYKGIKVRQIIARQDYWFRWSIMSFGVLFILLFGIWGSGYDASSFLYFQF